MDFTSVEEVEEREIKYSVGFFTDIGGGHENQDRVAIFDLDDGTKVMVVTDGHGKQYGGFFAKATVDFLKEYICANFKSQFHEDKRAFIQRMFTEIQNHLRESIIGELTSNGYIVDESNGYPIFKANNDHSEWSVLLGGTTLSMVIITMDNKMYIANVGDSSVKLCSDEQIFSKGNLKYLSDTSLDADKSDAKEMQVNAAYAMVASENSKTLELIRSHDCQDLGEFKTCRDRNPNHDLNFKYDTRNVGNYPIFSVTTENICKGPLPPSSLYYFKNVNKEIATYVTSPRLPHRPWNVALAFTRSFGDFALNNMGLTYLPEVQEIDLGEVLHSQPVDSMLCLALCTDGVWDNWTDTNLQEFVCHTSCVDAVRNHDNGAQRVCDSFCARNELFGRNNFGSTRDNASGILLYIRR